MKKTEKKGYIHPIVAIVNREPLCQDGNGVSGIGADKELYNKKDTYDSTKDTDDGWKNLGAKGSLWDSDWE